MYPVSNVDLHVLPISISFLLCHNWLSCLIFWAMTTISNSLSVWGVGAVCFYGPMFTTNLYVYMCNYT